MTPRAHSTGQQSVLVLGGGLAGIAASIRLAESGLRVTLLETRKRLGGRATSHVDPNTGRLLDNCQHVLLGCCTNLIDLYQRLGVADQIEWHDTLHFLDRLGHHDILSRNTLPAPMHLGGSMLKFHSLSWPAKWAIARAMLAMLRLPPQRRNDEWTGKTFHHWLIAHDQPPEAIDRFWNVIVVSALNEVVQTACAAHALQVFQEGFLAHRDAYLVGLSKVPLAQLYDPAAPLLERYGGNLQLGAAVRHIHFADGRITGIEFSDGQTLQADLYVSALPVERLDKLVTPVMRQVDARLAPLGDFSFSPILGIHLWFDREVMKIPHAITLDSPLQWVFNRGLDPQTGQQHLHVVISAAYDWIDLPADQILQRVLSELAIYLPRSSGAGLSGHQVIKERRATFSATPQIEPARPDAAGAISNLFLAGDYCRTGWPATMEGAVRSGYLAAAAITGQPMAINKLPPAWAVNMLWATAGSRL